MLSNQILVFLTAFSAMALAVPTVPKQPAAPLKPVAPPKPTATVVSQQNSCGNGAEVYCCATDGEAKGLYSTCSLLLGAGAVCTQTTVCCNANDSINICLGNAVIV